MGTRYVPLKPNGATFLSSAFPQRVNNLGTNIPVPALLFDATANESAFWRFDATGYASGNLTVDIYFYAVNATSGDSNWGASIACITPDSDSQDIETDSLATENTQTKTHPGTTSKRLLKVTVTVSNLDSIADGDEVAIRIKRLSTSNTMSNDAAVVLVRVSYTTA